MYVYICMYVSFLYHVYVCIKSYVIKKRLRNVIFMRGVNPCYAHASYMAIFHTCQVWTVSLSSQRLKNLAYKYKMFS